MHRRFWNQPSVPPPLPPILRSPVGMGNMISAENPEKGCHLVLPSPGTPPPLVSRPKHDTAHIRSPSPEPSIGPSMPKGLSRDSRLSVSPPLASPTPPKGAEMPVRSTTPDHDPVQAASIHRSQAPLPRLGNRSTMPVPPPLIKSSRPKGGAGTHIRPSATGTPVTPTASIRASGLLSSSSLVKLRGQQVAQLLATSKRSPSLSSHQGS